MSAQERTGVRGGGIGDPGALATREAGNRETAALPSQILHRTGQDGELPPPHDPQVLQNRLGLNRPVRGR
jgi:hypothetical protein